MELFERVQPVITPFWTVAVAVAGWAPAAGGAIVTAGGEVYPDPPLVIGMLVMPVCVSVKAISWPKWESWTTGFSFSAAAGASMPSRAARPMFRCQ